MKLFTRKHSKSIAGILECFDRIVFKGHLPLSRPDQMMWLMTSKSVLLKDFDKFVKPYAEKLKQHAMALAKKHERPYTYLNRGGIRKEDEAKKIAKKDGITQGLICVFSSLEACYGYRLKYGHGRPSLFNATRKCLCLYYYFMDPVFGLLHVRIQTWFPFTIQICMNGHSWLAKRMETEGMDYLQDENCFAAIDDFEKAQKISDEFEQINWPDSLASLAKKVNPLFEDILSGMEYYWVADQAEYATDVVFKADEETKPLYKKLLDYAISRFGAKDILTFLGKRLDGRFKGKQVNVCKKREDGTRVRHWVKRNWMKMYNKGSRVLRVETVINNPYDFRIYREGIKKGQPVTGWFPMSKRVGNLYRYKEICQTANGRYLDALAAQDDPRPTHKDMSIISGSVKSGKNSVGGFNPANEKDIAFFSEVMRAEHLLRGFCNADIRLSLFGETNDTKQKKRDASRTWRLFKKLHLRKLIAKIPHTRKWRITQNGSRILGLLIAIFNQEYPATMNA